MLNKKSKVHGSIFAREVLEFLILAFLIAAFFYFFLSQSSISIGQIWLEHQEISLTPPQSYTFHIWVRSVCILASALVFLILFLFLLGQRLAYVTSIIRGVELLRETHLDFSIPVEGKDEFATLAESINYLSLSQKELGQKEEELRQKREAFIRSLSHDIRTPLSAILAYSEYMESKETLTQEETSSYIALVQSKAQQIKHLTDQLLGKAETADTPIENVKFLLEQLAFEWEEILEDSFACQIDTKDCEEFSASADLYSLRRIFDNLASNVEKYAEPSQPVLLKLSASNGQIEIYQKNTVRKDKQPGTESHKIGLNSIQEIAESKGGHMNVTVSPDEYEISIVLCLKNSL
ncbi:MAG TPA: HAMP domain-containing histidine kinase [Candidatus Hungatella pullicola]|nr:HAMP domain-containing histidine kinase [Candidatus Hungatella pullicola]